MFKIKKIIPIKFNNKLKFWLIGKKKWKKVTIKAKKIKPKIPISPKLDVFIFKIFSLKKNPYPIIETKKKKTKR